MPFQLRGGTRRCWTTSRPLTLLCLILAASLSAQSPPPATSAAARYEAAWTLERAGRIAEAQAAYRASLAAAAEESDTATLANAQYRLGITFWAGSRHDSALVHLRQALTFRQRAGDTTELARVLNGLGASYYQLGLYEPALDAFVQAQRWRRTRHDTVGLARTLTNIGKTYHDWGQLERGRAKYLEAITVAAASPSAAPALGYAYNSLALLEIDAGRFDIARGHIARSRDAYGRPGATMTALDSSDVWEFNAAAMGVLLLREGRPAEARPLLDSVLAAATARRSVRGRVQAQVHLGEALLALGDTARARQHFLGVVDIALGAGQRVLALEAVNNLANLEAGRNPVRALQYLRQYQALRDSVFAQDVALRIASREANAETEAARRDNVQLRELQEAQALTITRQRLVVTLGAIILLLVSSFIALLVRFNRRERARAAVLVSTNADLARLNDELRLALTEVQTLSGLIPICSSCKRVRDDQGYWQAVETWVSSHSDATFSHSICQRCGPQLYGDLWPADAVEPVMRPAEDGPVG